MAIYSATVAAPAAFPAAASPSFSIPFQPTSIVIVNEDPTLANTVEFSFDGVNVHGRLVPTIMGAIKLNQTAQKIWVRRGAGSPNVQIIAEG